MMWWTLVVTLAATAWCGADSDILPLGPDYSSRVSPPFDNLPHLNPEERNLQASQFYPRDDGTPQILRSDITVPILAALADQEFALSQNWKPSFGGYKSLIPSPLGPFEESALAPRETRSFSPWGGKRTAKYSSLYPWDWKRAGKESNMPKRVRFSPWGGKRSEVPKSLSSFSATYSSLSPDLKKQLLRNIIDRADPYFSAFRHGIQPEPIKDVTNFRSFNSAEESNKVGKRKVKFSAWGGKRSSWNDSDETKEKTEPALGNTNEQSMDGKEEK